MPDTLDSFPVPMQLGYFLCETGHSLCEWPSVECRGVDRLYFTPTTEDVDVLRRNGRTALADLWDRWWDAEEDGEIRVDSRRAHEFATAFTSEGVGLELMYAELTYLPTDFTGCTDPYAPTWPARLAETLAVLARVHNKLRVRPTDLRRIGFDLSYPIQTFHSAIFEPGARKLSPELPSHLNEYGLFADASTAREFAEQANQVLPGHAPYCVLEVLLSP